MTDQSQGLGGRLPLLDPACLGDDQRKLYDRISSTMVRWANSIHFQSKDAGGRLIGPFNPVLFSPEIASAFLDLQDAEQQHTTLTDRVRQVVILAVGAAWNAPYELYAHAAAARHAGIPEDADSHPCCGRAAGRARSSGKAGSSLRPPAVGQPTSTGLYAEAEDASAREDGRHHDLAGIYYWSAPSERVRDPLPGTGGRQRQALPDRSMRSGPRRRSRPDSPWRLPSQLDIF